MALRIKSKTLIGISNHYCTLTKRVSHENSSTTHSLARHLDTVTRRSSFLMLDQYWSPRTTIYTQATLLWSLQLFTTLCRCWRKSTYIASEAPKLISHCRICPHWYRRNWNTLYMSPVVNRGSDTVFRLEELKR